ncbi:FlgB family protein [Pseudotabrizicola sp. L79]|uniref:FlgB family protein n=1 Tax=Pseudotabrizicola sp. L79 TaxID=3118402 RepID=UPI002F91E965
MFEKLGLTKMAQGLASYSGARLAIIAENVANADTPRYRAKDLPDFASAYDGMASFSARATRPDHLLAPTPASVAEPVLSGGSMAPNGNDVSIDLQIMKSVEVRQNHEMALAVYRSTSSILRTSLGRSG